MVLTLFPPETKIQAIRLWDTKSASLPTELIDDFKFPGVVVPQSLQYLGWECKKGKKLYRLEREEERIRLVECEPLRRVTEAERNWTDDRILEYEE